jgi:hypothetical protein
VVPALLRAVLAARPGTRFELRQGSRELCVEALEAAASDAARVLFAVAASRDDWLPSRPSR